MLRKLLTHVGLLALLFAATIPGQSFAQMRRGMMTPQMNRAMMTPQMNRAMMMNQRFVPQMGTVNFGTNRVLTNPRFNTFNPRADFRSREFRQDLLNRGFDRRLIDRRLNTLNPNAFDQRAFERNLLRDQQLLMLSRIRVF